MGLSAVESVGDAIDVTREFLTPLAAGRWLKLSAVVFLLSGGGLNLSTSVPPLPPTLDPTYRGLPEQEPTGAEQPPPEDVRLSELLPEVSVEVVAAAVAVLAVTVLAYLAVQALAEFVFVDSLRSGTVAVRRYADRWWRASLSLLAFRLSVWAGAVALVGGAVLSVLELGIRADLASAGALIAPLGVVVGLLASLVNQFTSVFVVPVMIQEERGLLSSWRRFWPAVTGSVTEFVAYAIIRYVLGMVLAAVAAAAVLAIAGLAGLAIAVVAGAALLASGAGVTNAAVLAVIAALGLLFVAILAAVAAVVQVPVQSYLRYYALLVLGDVDTAFDLIPEQRERARDRTLGVGRREPEPADR